MAIPTYGPKDGPDQDSIQDGRMTSLPGIPTPTSIPVEKGAAVRLTKPAGPNGQRVSSRVSLVLELQDDRRSRQG